MSGSSKTLGDPMRSPFFMAAESESAIPCLKRTTPGTEFTPGE
ncbi:hypothetical protein [Allocoleopsis franciscana]|nr:hypothetical protein [Allocoleopsis franciscana]